MVAIADGTLQKIKNAHGEVEPLIMEMIKGSNESNCPYKLMKEGDPESKETKEAVARVARMLYKHGLLNKLGISLSSGQAFDAVLYAFGYWGGRTLYKHGNEICGCPNKCY